ncbi:MAG: SDR family NAD(P)-dependent oxidoreductase [Halioglobus sp.]
MSNNPAIQKDNVAVITGGADGIGKAAAEYFKSQGMRLCIADLNASTLDATARELGDVLALQIDVADRSALETLCDEVYAQFGQVDVLMNNAGTAFGTHAWGEYDNWCKTLNVNLFGVLNGVQTFVPKMIEQNTPGLVINTGSKQGITNPPGDPAYNTTKAAVRALTEQLQHSFRNTENCQLSAHLLVPGFVYTGLVRQFLPEKPEGAWWPEQVAEYMAAALDRGDFYIICPDNDATEEMDRKRMAWTMGDLIENRPALSRWHPDYEADFERHMNRDDA